MDKIIIEGGRPLKGEVNISGAKNAALPILAASLLTDGWNTFFNVPDLKDIQSIKLLLSTLGAKIESKGTTVRINSSGLCKHEAPYELVRKMRASILVLGPLLARLKKAKISLPGGCAIGERPINLHLKGFAALGAKIKLEHGYVEAEADHLFGNEVYFDVATVTGTENVLMASVLAKGITTLRNAACEPEIKALADFLNKMGANITGEGTPVITINGVDSLKPVAHKIIPDRIEAGTSMAASAITGGDVKIIDCEPGHLSSVINKLKLTGAKIEVKDKTIRVTGPDEITSVDIKTREYPGFPTDMQAQFMALMTVAKGMSIINENIFENRFIHAGELKRMGADITITGQTAVVKGVTRLLGAPVMASDLRASASLIIAGLAAEGTTEVHRVYHLDRGYEAIEKKFQNLGAAIKRAAE
ncbi:MAG TPA: UDP-N-acetylglucosamine 1-carboxyvinyltransferase [Desulfobacteraceae bacterium]|nr:UDP-N-acetylglucosamine 1-carboxyvinyltransferase [Desulfobacteraceae bacterium]